MMLFWALDIGTMLLVIRQRAGKAHESGAMTHDATALEIQCRRHSSGELDTAQLTQKQHDIVI